MSKIAHTTAATFHRDVLLAPLPVLLDFYADWCGPCRALSPTLERLAQEFAGKVRIVKINVDEEPELASRYQVSAIPTLIFFERGEIVGQTAGASSEVALRRVLQQLAQAA